MKALNSLHRLRALAALGLALLAMPAAAEPTPIEVAENATWSHDAAQVRLPPAIDGFRRTGIVDYGTQRFDVSARYLEDSSETTAHVYLFRAPLPDVSLWHDRAQISIQPSEALGTPNRAAARTATFVPPGSDVASGLTTVMPVSGAAPRSTALAVLPHGEWLVKVRMTSNRDDPAQLAARIATFVAALPLDPAGTAHAAATPMAYCAEPVPWGTAERGARPNVAVMLALAASAGVGGGLEQARDVLSAPNMARLPSGPFCRDRTSQPGFGIYRRGGTVEQYVIGFGDAGGSATVGRDPMVQSLQSDEVRDNFWVSFADPYKTSFYRGFESLPNPGQVIAVVQGEQPLSSVERNADGKPKINLVMDAPPPSS